MAAGWLSPTHLILKSDSTRASQRTPAATACHGSNVFYNKIVKLVHMLHSSLWTCQLCLKKQSRALQVDGAHDRTFLSDKQDIKGAESLPAQFYGRMIL